MNKQNSSKWVDNVNRSWRGRGFRTNRAPQFLTRQEQWIQRHRFCFFFFFYYLYKKMVQQFLDYVEKNQSSFVERLRKAVAIPR